MDAFRDVSLGDTDLYVIDAATGHTKAVVDRFYSLIWTERFAEAGEFELSGPEETVWAGVIEEGDYLQFTASSTTEHGRYTMVVESRYTSWDAEKGYTVFANGRSLESILDRRIIIDTEPWDGDDPQHYEEFKWVAGYPAQGRDDLMNKDGWPHKRNMTGDETQYFPDTDDYIVAPMSVEYVDNTNSPTGANIADAVYKLVECNMGVDAKESRQFGRFFETFKPESFMSDTKESDGRFQNIIGGTWRAEKPIQGTFENLYDFITDLLSETERRQNSYGLRITGEMRQIERGAPETEFHMTFELIQGRDLTIDNGYGYPPVIFAKDWDNAITLEYVHGEANFKNSLFYDPSLDYTPDDLYEMNQRLIAIDYINDAIGYETSPLKPLAADADEDQREQYEKRKKQLEKLRSDMDKHIAKLQQEMDKRDSEMADIDRRLLQIEEKLKDETLSDHEKSNLEAVKKKLTDEKPKLQPRKDEDQKWKDTLQKHRDALNNVEGDIEVPEERSKELNDEQKLLQKDSKNISKQIEQRQKEYESAGHRELYYGTYGRDYANPAWEDSWLNADQGPIGLDRRELYYQNTPIDWVNQIWTGRFGEYQFNTDDDGNEIVQYPDWPYYCQVMNNTAHTELKKKDYSKEDNLEATVNYNVMFKPTLDYDVGDRVTVMGIWNNESVRVMRCKEMVYSVDASGFTVVPSFVMLEENEGM